jgi:phage terminase small subunit
VGKLTARQKRFCEEYLIDLNATQAAIRAGYSKKTANEQAAQNLAKLSIQEYIREKMNEKDDELIAKQDEVLKTLTRILRRQEKEVIVVTCKERTSGYDENGKKVITEREVPQLVEIPTQIKDVNRAAELLGKRYGLYTDKVEQQVDMDLNIIVDYGDDDAG